MWTSTTGGDYHGNYGLGPWVDAYRTSDGAIIHRGYTYNPDTSSFTVDIPSMYPYDILDPDIVKKLEMEEPKMEIQSNEDPHSLGRRYAVSCSHEPDLSQERILKSISVMKAKLMMQCAPVRLLNIECRMTPAVKQNIIMAYKKLQMYGKKTPFVARFDEYGRRLPDEVKIDTLRGMTIKIVDPVEYGHCYLMFEGVVKDLFTRDYTYTDVDPEDIPF